MDAGCEYHGEQLRCDVEVKEKVLMKKSLQIELSPRSVISVSIRLHQ